MAKETLVASVAGLKQQVQSLIGMIGTASRNAAASMESNGGTISTGSNFLNNYLGAFSSNASTRAVSRMNGLGQIAQGTFSAVGGAFSMMPDVGATIQRAGTYYNATLMAGNNMSRATMQRATFSGLNGGITSPGSDQAVAGYLASRGMGASNSYNSTYQQTVRSVGNAAKYLNMSNERAVAAVEGLTSGQGSSNMLRQFGILTGDLATGKSKTQGQIFSELYGRMTAGQTQATVEETQESLRKGNLGAMLRNSGLSEDQQSMFAQYAIERAKGNNMDLSDQRGMDALMKKAEAEGNKNPFLPGYDLNTAKTSAMQKAEGAYIAGIEAATPALVGLTEAAGSAAGALGAIKAAAALFAGDAVGRGFGQMLGGAGQAVGGGMIYGAGGGKSGKLGGIVGSGGSAGGGIYYNNKTGRYHDSATNKMVKTPAGMTAGTPGGNKFNLGNALKGAKVPGLIGAGLTAATVLPGAVSAAQQGAPMGATMGNAIGSIAGGALGGVLGQALIPIPGLGFMIGSMAGSFLGGMAGEAIGGAMDPAGGDTGTQAGTSTAGAPQPFSLIHPITPAKITARFGQKTKDGVEYWPNGHKGVDYAATMGQGIFASADGEITPTDAGGQLGNYVRIRHANGMYTFYCHLSEIVVRRGTVKQGQLIGKAGSTGYSSGVHLHFAVSTSESTANAVDPERFLQGGATSEYDSSQSASGENPSAQGETSSGRSTLDGQASPASGATNILTTTKTGYAAAGSPAGSSSAVGVEPWSAGSFGGSSASQAGSASASNNAAGGDGPDLGSFGETSALATTSIGARKASGGRSTTNHVTIHLNIAKATDDEAKRFAAMLKKNLEEEKLLKNMARGLK